MRRAGGVGSRISTFLRADGLSGTLWIKYGLFLHAMAVCGPIGTATAIGRGDHPDVWLGLGVSVAALAGTAAYWWYAVRVWRRLPAPATPAEPDARAVVYDPNGAGDESVRRLA